MAGLTPGAPLDVRPVQPAVLGDPEPLARLAVQQLQRLQRMVVQEPEPAAVPEPVQVSVPKAPPEEVPALLALLLAEPVAVPQPPRALGEAPRVLQAPLPVPLARPIPQPLPLSGTVALPESLRDNARAALLRLWPHDVPGGAQELAGAVQDEVAEPHAISLK